MKYVLLTMLCCLTLTTTKADDYKLVKKEDRFSIYERWTARNSGTKVRELKVTYYAQTSINEIVALLKNEEAGRKWNDCAESYHIVNKGDGYWVNYIKHDVPFPLDDQDWCVQYYYAQQRSGYAELYFESTSDNRFPVAKNTKRITGVNGRWILEDSSNGNVHITYIISTNRDSSVPRWIADPIIHNTMLETMSNFKNLLENNVYE